MGNYGWWDSVNEAAFNRYPSLLYQWLPGGAVAGGWYVVGSLSGERGKSLKINLKSGEWKDWAPGGGKGGSNPISLYAACRGISYREAGPELARQLGVPDAFAAKRERRRDTPIVPIPDDAPYDENGHPIAPERLREAGVQPRRWFPYCDAQGGILMWRVRFEKPDGAKTDILPLTYCVAEDGRRHWRWFDLPAPRPLYGLDLLAAMPAAPVVVVEGEAKCDAAREICPEFCWIAWAGGTNRVKSANWSALAQRKTPVYIWPDNDDPGKKAALEVAAQLPPATTRLIEPDPAWPAKWDVHDLIKGGWDGARIGAWIAEHQVEPVPITGKPKEERFDFDLTRRDLGLWQKMAWEIVRAINGQEPALFASIHGLCMVTRDPFRRPLIKYLNAVSMRGWLGARIRFARSNQYGLQEALVPEELAASMLALPAFDLPVLARISRFPVFVGEGRLLARPGYDGDTAFHYMPEPGLEELDLNENPGEEDLRAARELIEDLIADFPFAEDSDKTHALALMLLPVVRPMIAGPTPLHRIEAPTPGTGKTLLADTLLAPTVREVTLLTETADEEEWRKVIAGALYEGAGAVLIDNCRELRSGVLAGVLTTPTCVWQARFLGTPEIRSFRVDCVWAATMNNPALSREMARRSVRIRVDAQMERPEERIGFRHSSLREYIAANRRDLIQALVTVCAYGLKYAEAGAQTPLLGSFERWSRVMGRILTAAGYTAFLAASAEEDEADNETSSLVAFVRAWRERFGHAEVRAIELMECAERAEMEVKGTTERAREISLGMLMRRMRGRIFDRCQIKRYFKNTGSFYSLHYRSEEPDRDAVEPSNEGKLPF